MRPNAYTGMWSYLNSQVAIVHLFSPSTNQIQDLRGTALRGLILGLVGLAVLIGGASRLMAGCHYGDGRSFGQVKHSDNPREHARNFSFLGQWVYERGEIKYVPWQGNPPCHGPHCRAEKPLPVSTGAPVSSVHRLPSVILLSVKSNSFSADVFSDWLSHEDRSPRPGFAFEHEHPPRVPASL